MKSSYRVIVVGGGIVGASVFHRLSQFLGNEVLMIERSRLGMGATGFSGGILRAFHLDPQLSDLAARGLQQYRTLEAASRDRFTIHKTGFLKLIDPVNLDKARFEYLRLSPHVDLEWMPAAAAADRFNLSIYEGLSAAVYEPNAGYVDPYALNGMLIDLGKRNGGTTLTGVELNRLRTVGEVACGITTNAGEIDCSTIVLCTGAWSPTLVAQLGIKAPQTLRSKAIQVNLFHAVKGIPEFPAFVDLSTGAYGRPNGDNTVFVGKPVDEWDINPNTTESPSEKQSRDARELAMRRFRWGDKCRAIGGYRRYDSYTASGRGIAGWSPSLRGVVLATGFSGGGVKLAPAVSDMVAAMVVDKKDRRLARTVDLKDQI
jgi:sarcosine oxidase subunit beta